MRYVLLFLYQMQPNLKPIEILVYTQPRPNEAPNNNPSKLPMQPDDKHATYPLFRLISFACLSLKPLHKALISGYGLFISSNACGITRTAHELTLAFWPALKQRQKYPGCLGSIQNAQTDRLGLASVQVVNQRSVYKLVKCLYISGGHGLPISALVPVWYFSCPIISTTFLAIALT